MTAPDSMADRTLGDCFAIADGLISLDDAHAFIARKVPVTAGTETVPLAQAMGRILAEDIVAPIDQPPFRNSAMDGFGCRAADLTPDGASLAIVGRVAAGHPYLGAVAPGCAVEIFTGAPLPDELDTVVMIEDCGFEMVAGRRHVRIPGGAKPHAHVRPSGEDFRRGTPLLARGRRLRPQDVALAAAAGRPALVVYRRLVVGVFSTGDEVIEPGFPLGPGQIWSSNRVGQLGLVSGWGHEAVDLGHLPDDAEIIGRALSEAAVRVDALVTSGGASVGGEDHIRAVVEQRGALHMWRLALKPGKPVALGRIGETAFLGMPGNPVSALVSLMLVGRVVLNRMAGRDNEPPMPPAIPLPANFSYARKRGRREFMRGSLDIDSSGAKVNLYRTQDSVALTSLAQSDGLIDMPSGDAPINHGDLVPYISFEHLLR
jgi:molybdopterin molybdotransferase